MKIKNLNIRPKAIALAVAGTLATASLTGCNYDLIDTKLTFNKALIFGDNRVTIVEIQNGLTMTVNNFKLLQKMEHIY